MLIEIGEVEAIFRYPVKSMRGQQVEAASMGWHGIEGDRRFALRCLNDRGEFPWLTAGRLPELLLFTPEGCDDGRGAPSHIRTPGGDQWPVFSEELAADIERRHGAPVEMMRMKHGVFDEAAISLIAMDTVREVARLAGQSADVRRFRPNVVVRSLRSTPFQEDNWVGRVLSFGEGDESPEVTVTSRDVRCAMLNLDPDTARPATEMMKAVVRANDNNAGVYATVTRVGELRVGQKVFLR